MGPIHRSRLLRLWSMPVTKLPYPRRSTGLATLPVKGQTVAGHAPPVSGTPSSSTGVFEGASFAPAGVTSTVVHLDPVSRGIGKTQRAILDVLVSGEITSTPPT